MEDTELVNYLFWPWGSWKAEWKTNKSFVVVLVVTSNYFRWFCDKLQHLLDIPAPSLDACSAACSVDYQRQICLKFPQDGKINFSQSTLPAFFKLPFHCLHDIDKIDDKCRILLTSCTFRCGQLSHWETGRGVMCLCECKRTLERLACFHLSE